MENKKVAIITGASRGIGEYTSVKFAANGYRCTLVGRSKGDLNRVEKSISEKHGMEVLRCEGDIGDGEFLKEIIRRTIEKWGRIDVLVNNAAWRTIETMRTISPDTWNKTISVCLTAPAFLAKYCAAEMEKLKTGGAIINISSIMSNRAGGNSPAYIACKGGIDSLTRELAIAYGRSNIRVIGVNPGYIKTEMSNDYVDSQGKNLSAQMSGYIVDATPLGRGGHPEELAEVIYWLSSPAASFITGTTITADGGFSSNLNDYLLKKKQFPQEF